MEIGSHGGARRRRHSFRRAAAEAGGETAVDGGVWGFYVGLVIEITKMFSLSFCTRGGL